MITTEEWKRRMNMDGQNIPVCDICDKECDAGLFPEHIFQINFDEMDDASKFWFRSVTYPAQLRFGQIMRTGYSCEYLNRWIFGLDDEQMVG